MTHNFDENKVYDIKFYYQNLNIYIFVDVSLNGTGKELFAMIIDSIICY